MRLIQLKVRCLQGVTDTGWFVPGRETSVIYGGPGSGKSSLLEALQALNPLYDIRAEDPFADYPTTWRQGPHTRRIIPAKKTAVFMVFSADPEEVKVLSTIDPVLIETDRIEVGRRLDYSRWLTFVEISGSTRYSEISQSLSEICSHLEGLAGSERLVQDFSTIQQLKATDRLEKTDATLCWQWLVAAAPLLSARHHDLLDFCLKKIGRADRFALARRVMKLMLPSTLCITSEHRLLPEYALNTTTATDSNDPVAALVRQLTDRYHLNDSHNSCDQELMTALRRGRDTLRPLLPAEMVFPRMRLQGSRMIIEPASSADDCLDRLNYVAAACLLSFLYSNRMPLLLLDRLEQSLSHVQSRKLVRALQQLSRVCQLIWVTDNKDICELNGWQKVQEIPPGGLTVNKLSSGK